MLTKNKDSSPAEDRSCSRLGLLGCQQVATQHRPLMAACPSLPTFRRVAWGKASAPHSIHLFQWEQDITTHT